MKMKHLILAIVTLLTLCLSTVTARADDLTFTLKNPFQNMGAIGGILTFEATVSAPLTNLDSVYLNGDAYTLAGALTLDDSGFLDFPLAMTPGESFTGILFKVIVPTDTMNGTYSNTFSILGGGVGALDTLATVGFNVSVVPEPSSISLALTAALVTLIRFRKNGGRGHRRSLRKSSADRAETSPQG
jgi:hypothetical protein